MRKTNLCRWHRSQGQTISRKHQLLQLHKAATQGFQLWMEQKCARQWKKATQTSEECIKYFVFHKPSAEPVTPPNTLSVL